MLNRKKRHDTEYQTYSSYMCKITYFDTFTHSLQNLRIPNDFYAPLLKVMHPFYFYAYKIIDFCSKTLPVHCKKIIQTIFL